MYMFIYIYVCMNTYLDLFKLKFKKNFFKFLICENVRI